MAGFVSKVFLLFFLYWYSWFFLTATMLDLGDHPGFVHFIHTVFHEAGHVLLSWAPQLLYYFGGTLGQLTVPMALAIAFLVKYGDRFSASVCFWWFGQSLVDVAPYINDARASRLILLGGATGSEIEGHDWNYILEQLHILQMDVKIARVVLASGRLIMILALVAALVFVVMGQINESRKRNARSMEVD